jgi:hypothetical protein
LLTFYTIIMSSSKFDPDTIPDTIQKLKEFQQLQEELYQRSQNIIHRNYSILAQSFSKTLDILYTIIKRSSRPSPQTVIAKPIISFQSVQQTAAMTKEELDSVMILAKMKKSK